jgi:hypothetical protein
MPEICATFVRSSRLRFRKGARFLSVRCPGRLLSVPGAAVSFPGAQQEPQATAALGDPFVLRSARSGRVLGDSRVIQAARRGAVRLWVSSHRRANRARGGRGLRPRSLSAGAVAAAWITEMSSTTVGGSGGGRQPRWRLGR